MALAAREADAPFADPCIVPLGQVLDERMGMGGTGRLLHLSPLGTGSAVGDVLGDRGWEQVGILRDEGELGADIGGVHLPRVVTPYVDGSLVGRVEEAEEFE